MKIDRAADWRSVLPESALPPRCRAVGVATTRDNAAGVLVYLPDAKRYALASVGGLTVVRTSMVKAALRGSTAKRRKPGAGRKPSGRVLVSMLVLPAAKSALLGMAADNGTSMGKEVERLLAEATLPAGSWP